VEVTGNVGGGGVPAATAGTSTTGGATITGGAASASTVGAAEIDSAEGERADWCHPMDRIDGHELQDASSRVEAIGTHCRQGNTLLLFTPRLSTLCIQLPARPEWPAHTLGPKPLQTLARSSPWQMRWSHTRRTHDIDGNVRCLPCGRFCERPDCCHSPGVLGDAWIL
jgi:hypothetical protein